eukprot:92565-Pelagomonas_calceolata.AAC.1
MGETLVSLLVREDFLNARSLLAYVDFSFLFFGLAYERFSSLPALSLQICFKGSKAKMSDPGRGNPGSQRPNPPGPSGHLHVHCARAGPSDRF